MTDHAEFKIERGIPIPKGRTDAYPFQRMKVGDSVFFPNKDVTAMSGSLQYAQIKIKGKFTRRTVTERGVKGVRVWRIA